LSATDIIHLHDGQALHRLIESQIDRAQEYYRRAYALLPEQDRKSQRPGLVMAAIYQKLLEEIRIGGCNVLNQRISLTPLRKLWIAWRTWVIA